MSTHYLLGALVLARYSSHTKKTKISGIPHSMGARNKGQQTHRKERSTVHSKLYHLDGSLISGLDGRVGRERDLREADGARVRVLAGPQDLEGRNHGKTHVPRPAVGPVGAEAHVDVKEGRGVALEPARLEGDGAACCGPVCAVRCCWVATAYVSGKIVSL
jgi:hypothetical protein